MKFSPFDSEERIYVRSAVFVNCFVVLEPKVSGKHLTHRWNLPQETLNAPGRARNLRGSWTTPHEMQNEKDYTHDEQEVD
jgi:hypothetical protein